MLGYACKVLRVDLTNQKVEAGEVGESLLIDYLGGRGLAARLLYDELSPGTDPLGPGNIILFATGPFDNTNLPGSSRHLLCMKSPLTGGWGDANVGGNFGRMLKRAGFDVIVITGASDRPVYLWVNEGKAELRDASHLWGLSVGDTTDRLLEETYWRAEVAAIGPAGENMVRYACMISDYNRAAGRSGAGAVMGSKKLKAVVTFGNQKTTVFDEENLNRFRRELAYIVRTDPSCLELRENGTAGGVAPYNELGMYAAYNFRVGQVAREKAQAVTGETITKTILVKREGCPGCPIGCKRVVKVESGPFSTDPKYGGPEFETVGALGTCTGVFNLEAVAKAHELCNRYGLDGINTGISIAWAMECYEKGLITESDTGGLPLKWGDAEVLLAVIEQIAYGKGIGKLLGKGLKRAAEEIGQGTAAFAMQSKNQAFAIHMPRAKIGQGLSYATSNRGACHMQGMHDETIESGRLMPEIGIDDKFSGIPRMSKELKPEFEVLAQNLRAFQDSLIICRFVSWDSGPITPSMLAQLLYYITGREYFLDELMVLGERVYNLCRMFNVREGFSRKDDTLPARVGERFPPGGGIGSVITPEDLEAMLDRYYELRGWDREGVPRKETLERLGLEP